MPGVVGMGQSLELWGLGPYGNLQLEDWRRQGSWAWCSRWSCWGSDRRRTRTPRARIEEDEEWGYGLTVPRSERSTIREVCETLGRPHQVRPEAHARSRCSRRALLPIETPFEPAFEPPIATSSEGSSEWAGHRVRGSGARSRVRIQATQGLGRVHLDAGRGEWLGRLCGLARHVLGILVLFLREPAVALRHQPLDLRPRLTSPLLALGSHLSQANQPIVILTVATAVRRLPDAVADLLLTQWIAP